MAQACQIQMAEYVASLRNDTFVKRFTSAYRAGLLTVLPSRILDVMLNSMMAVLETTKHPLAAGIDRAVHRGISGQRARMFDVSDLGKASWAAVRKTPADLGAALKGRDPFDSKLKWDQASGEVSYGDVPVISPLMTYVVNGVFRVMGATDAPFTRLAFERSLREQARLMGHNQGLRGQQLEAYIEALMPQMPDEAVVRASHDAMVATLKDETPMAAALSGFKAGLRQRGGAAGELAGDVVLPFTRIPSNVAHRTTEYTPAGMAMGALNLVRAFRLAKNADRMSEATALQAHAVDQMARSSLGLAAIAAGYWLAEDGKLSLARPSRDQGQLGIWEATGQVENAIRVGPNWVQVSRMAPLGPLLLLGGYLHRATSSGELVPADIATTMAAGFGATVSDQPAFTAATELSNVREDPVEGGARWAQRTAASTVPGLVARAATYLDPVVREREGWLAAFQARIPGLSDQLPARHDVFGQQIPTRQGFFDNFVNPASPRPDRTAQSDFLKELQRVGVEVSRLRRDTARGETREQFYQRRESEGELLYTTMLLATQSEEYRDLPKLRRWAARTVPGMDQGRLEQQILEDQRLFLSEVRDRTRELIGRARRSPEGGYTVPQIREEALARDTRNPGILQRASGRVQEEIGAPTPDPQRP